MDKESKWKLIEELSVAIISGSLEFLKNHVVNGNDFNGMTLSAPGGYGKKPIELAVLSQFDHKGSLELSNGFVMEINKMVLDTLATASNQSLCN